eukprot:CAMPEP_0119465920 /NCGR_PEP_ID=MMETSP1344-20130328/823_1 /TAXON_ID=236787 /ORGANISM="Florenciella parvula, Strain CCMP2471" /LENGTH=111 /DNA_ID=CAMNT_0007498207 /DNA_START=198 /DNA_END=531 /DNA_ORIENTATION=+
MALLLPMRQAPCSADALALADCVPTPGTRSLQRISKEVARAMPSISVWLQSQQDPHGERARSSPGAANDTTPPNTALPEPKLHSKPPPFINHGEGHAPPVQGGREEEIQAE